MNPSSHLQGITHTNTVRRRAAVVRTSGLFEAVPALTRFLVADIDVESEDDEEGDQRCPPVDDKHHHHAQDCAGEGHPHVVVLEAGTPPCGERGERHTETRWKYGSM